MLQFDWVEELQLYPEDSRRREYLVEQILFTIETLDNDQIKLFS